MQAARGTSRERADAGPVVTDEVRVRRRPGVLWRRSLDAVVILPPGTGDTVILAGTGPVLWELLADWRTADDLVDALARLFAAPADQVRADVEPLLADLAARGALEASTLEASASDGGAPAGSASGDVPDGR